MMLVVHANWTSGALHFWGESLDAYRRTASASARARSVDDGGRELTGGLAVADDVHPFCASADEIARAIGVALGVEPEAIGRTASLAVCLPTLDGQPQPSDRLESIVGVAHSDAAPELERVTVPAVALGIDRTIDGLLALHDLGPDGALELGQSVRYWTAVAQLTVELLADQRFIPTLIQTRGADLHAAWQPWLHDESTRRRVGVLIAAMPPIVRAVPDAHEGRPWSILDDAMRTMTQALVREVLIRDSFAEAIEDRDPTEDPHVAWLDGLLHDGTRVVAPNGHATEMLRDVRTWIAELEDRGGAGTYRLGLTLDEPDVPPGTKDEDVAWRLRFALVEIGDAGVRIEAEEIWEDAPGLTAQVHGKADELLLAEIGRAARLLPALEAALSEAAPTGIDLATVDAYKFLTESRELLEESGVDVRVPAWWGQPAARLGAKLEIDAPAMHDGATAAPGLLGLNSLVQYRWSVAVGDRTLTMEEFNALVQAARLGSLMRLHGQWVEIRPDQINDAAAFFEEHPGGEMSLLEAIQLAHGAGGEQPGLPVTGLEATGWVSDLLEASSGTASMPRLDQPESLVGTLRPYQVVGLSWLAFLDHFGLGTCLADDMGLGKTVQLIALWLFERERANGPVGPTLLIVPTSVVSNWKREIERFAPRLTVHIQHGPDRPQGERLAEVALAHDVVVTTYTLISRDRESLSRIPWYRVALDEAQYIKNPPTKQTSTIRALKTTRRIALTGTPVENRLSELWSIMEFCNPGYLGQPGEFRRRFAIPVERQRDQHRAEQLRRLVRPFILRRLKTDPTVIDDLPPCLTTKEFATLTTEQAALYESTVNAMLGQVSDAEGIQRRGLVLATLVKLKQICNHPAQLPPADGSRATDFDGEPVLSSRSGKSKRIMEMLEEILATGDKALIFTQFRRMGHLLSAMIKHDLDAPVQFLHGGTPPAKRQQMIDRFQDPDGGVPIFLLSLKAGGVGLNLTAANHVFHYDRWWNPAVENQATDRAFRIGQTRTVHVHKFVCMGTLEERIDQMIEQKQELAQNIIGAGESWLTELDAGQLRELLLLRRNAVDGEGAT